MRVLVFQHIAVEHPGVFRDFLAADGIPWDVVELDEDDPIPDMRDYDILLVMGGPMDVWEEAAHPWLIEEKQAIREWVSAGRPYLGFCLGHQLLGEALGGSVGPMPVSEVGIMDVTLSEEGRADLLFQGLPETLSCMQWHSAGITQPPPGSAILASSTDCSMQAIRVGKAAYGIQFHIEVTGQTAGEWGCVSAYAESLEEVMGANALARLEAEMSAALPVLNRHARALYDNFMQVARDAIAP